MHKKRGRKWFLPLFTQKNCALILNILYTKKTVHLQNLIISFYISYQIFTEQYIKMLLPLQSCRLSMLSNNLFYSFLLLLLFFPFILFHKEGINPSYLISTIFLCFSSLSFGTTTSKTPLSPLASIFSTSAFSGRLKLLENLPNDVSIL